MGTGERGLIIAAGSHCPTAAARFSSLVGWTDIAITRVRPRKPPEAAGFGRLGRRRQAPEVLLAHHQGPSDVRAILLANATAATLRGLVASNLARHGSSLARLLLSTAIAPLTSSRRR